MMCFIVRLHWSFLKPIIEKRDLTKIVQLVLGIFYLPNLHWHLIYNTRKSRAVMYGLRRKGPLDSNFPFHSLEIIPIDHIGNISILQFPFVFTNDEWPCLHIDNLFLRKYHFPIDFHDQLFIWF
jgi:hypothetical protein